jgi:photosystem II stability/assembly factor-like uncharacterized protein
VGVALATDLRPPQHPADGTAAATGRRRRGCWLAALGVLAGCRGGPAPPPDALPWRLVPTPTTASLRALAVVDANVVWVGGADGTLLRTADGGVSWRDVAPPDCSGCDFRDLAAFDADVALALVAGQPARLYRTTDGGRNWTLVLAATEPTAFFDAIAFAGDDGVLLGDPLAGAFDVRISQDAGRSWRPLPSHRLPPARPGEAAFAASGSCAAIEPGPQGRLWLVTGGAATRCCVVPRAAGPATVVSLPLRHGAPSQGAFALAVRGERAVVVGGDHADPRCNDATAAWSDDGGRSWHAARTGAGGYRSAVVWRDADRLVAVGSHGTSRSDDGGRSWRDAGSVGFHAVAVGADGSLFACGSDGRLARWVAD